MKLSGVKVATIRRPSCWGSIPLFLSAFLPASTARLTVVSPFEIYLFLIPVLLVIHSSLVSTIRVKSWLSRECARHSRTRAVYGNAAHFSSRYLGEQSPIRRYFLYLCSIRARLFSFDSSSSSIFSAFFTSLVD